MLHFGFVDEAHVPETAVGKLVNDGASQPFCQIVVYQGSDICPYGIFMLSLLAAFQAAGGTTTSEGKGINELSMAINKVMVQ